LSFKKEIPYSDGLEIALNFLEKTQDLFRRAEIAGSLRRKESIVHDIDLAVIPKTKDFGAWESDLKKRVSEIGGSVITLGDVICNFRYRNVQLNLFVCLDESYWGVLFMWATGPKGHTIGMNIKAEKKRLHMSPKGLYTRDDFPKFIPTPTEQDVAKVLDWNFKPPEARGKANKKGAAERSAY
jgi:DNA polymerase/3'-5' exonuclease PolX